MSQGESKLSRKIQDEIRARGGFCFKVHGGPMMMNGLPDLIACYKGYFLSLETKMPDGDDPSPVQRHRHTQIRAAGGVAVVVRSVREARDAMDAIDASTAISAG